MTGVFVVGSVEGAVDGRVEGEVDGSVAEVSVILSAVVSITVVSTTVVPVEAICIENEDIFVYALEDGKAVKKTVELGISDDTFYEVLSGVNVGDVLIKNTSGLKDGVKVEVK